MNLKHRQFYLFGLALMIAGLPLSKFIMSISQFVILAAWLSDGYSFRLRNYHGNSIIHFLRYIAKLARHNFINKIKSFFGDRAAVVFTMLFFVHVVGLLWTEDFGYALKDLRTKLPILVFPVLLSTMKPLDKKEFRAILFVFIGAVLFGSLIAYRNLLIGDFGDIRDVYPFISHIRYSLNLNIAIFALVFFIYEDKNLIFRIFMAVLVTWMIYFMVITETAIGMLVFILVVFYLVLKFLFSLGNIYSKLSLTVIVLAFAALSLLFIHDYVKKMMVPEPVDFTQLDQHSPTGNPYIHDTVNYLVEDGRYTGLYIAYEELEKAWSRVSDVDFHGRDAKGHRLKLTLIRFLASKDYRKDSVGVSQLSEEEIRSIEKGIANVNYYENPGVKTRLSKLLLAIQLYKRNRDPSQNSLLQRLEYWRASIEIIKDHPLIGVGTGDIKQAFKSQYEIMESRLRQEFRHRSHNQYLHITAALGLLGLLTFMVILFYPPKKRGMFHDYFFSVFFIILLISMLTEDTIESQAGVSFFAFFASLFMFARKSCNK